jgi:hypothetical protein
MPGPRNQKATPRPPNSFVEFFNEMSAMYASVFLFGGAFIGVLVVTKAMFGGKEPPHRPFARPPAPPVGTARVAVMREDDMAERLEECGEPHSRKPLR